MLRRVGLGVCGDDFVLGKELVFCILLVGLIILGAVLSEGLCRLVLVVLLHGLLCLL